MDQKTKGLSERFKMTTKRKRAVTLYLDDALLAKLTKSAEHWNLSRNEAIIRILTAYLTQV